MIHGWHPYQLEALLEQCFEPEAVRRLSDPVVTLARWRARCGAGSPEQIRAWVRASMDDGGNAGSEFDDQPATATRSP